MLRIERFIRQLKENEWLSEIQLNPWTFKTCSYEAPGFYVSNQEDSRLVTEGDWLADRGTTFILEQEIHIPPSWRSGKVGLWIDGGGGEGLLYVNGIPYHGLDGNRSYIPLHAEVIAAGSALLRIEWYNPPGYPSELMSGFTDHIPKETDPPPLYLAKSRLVAPNEALQSFRYTIYVYAEAAKLLPDTDAAKLAIIRELHQVMDDHGFGEPGSWNDQNVWLDSELKLKERLASHTSAAGTMLMVGQSHIDTAWLWPLKETVRKVSRTFSTASTLLDEYPKFVYSQSQPQLYSYAKEHYPDVYDRVKRHIVSDRWEVVGGMWVEPDLNIPSGESLVRQLLHGMKFFREEFGAVPRIEWLPDTFGYCASLPQLLKLAGIEYFMTSKMGWNDTNAFPYDLFHWVGIDGTRILSFINHGLNEQTHPVEINDHWSHYKQKSCHPEQMLLYGYGDGGGGVTREMIENVERSANLPGLPSARHGTAHEFFDHAARSGTELPTWTGDLYLELHRGTYTTHARNKRWNRKAEALYREAEVWSSIHTLFGGAYPSEALAKGWKQVLLNQFHDIIPGTSIQEVYERSEQDYAEAFDIGEKAQKDAVAALAGFIEVSAAGGKAYHIFNSLSWKRESLVTITGGSELINVFAYDESGVRLKTDLRVIGTEMYELCVFVPGIPSLGYATIWLRQAEEHNKEHNKEQEQVITFDGIWETNLYSAEWNDRGELVRLYDKEAGREVLISGQPANQLQMFHDRPLVWDAWDIDPRFEKQPAELPTLKSAEVVHSGENRDILRFEWQLNRSSVTQNIIFYRDSRRIDFETSVSWNEKHKLLKVAFPVDILSSKATYEIPFGAVERTTHTNTSWDRAQFEVCGHRWADLSEDNYGVALLNDCKYGYDIKGNVLRLSLLRSSDWPDRTADQGDHQFTYSLYPHLGNRREANIVREGYELNHSLIVVEGSSYSKSGKLPFRHSFIHVEATGVILDTIKRSEDGDSTIIRLYESGGVRESIKLNLHLPLSAWQETNLLEEPMDKVHRIEETGLQVGMIPYQVRTLELKE
ncbi:hypothetical protein SY83_01625 [Paenibacillus swuensis]|uniref:alpha-mannosidase n=1 Tax=Paenibacillus swuensis TaxID=1178515 RepID=A0A172TDX9_9BACL|nr:alpha-mannosidase [Paenibacillus swuensis]ANE45241.1 hypothetical protein SY83_01625 [Paenibacillus swuensis]